MTTPEAVAALAKALHDMAEREAVGIVAQGEWEGNTYTDRSRPCTPADHETHAAAILEALDGWHLVPTATPTSEPTDCQEALDFLHAELDTANVRERAHVRLHKGGKTGCARCSAWLALAAAAPASPEVSSDE